MCQAPHISSSDDLRSSMFSNHRLNSLKKGLVIFIVVILLNSSNINIVFGQTDTTILWIHSQPFTYPNIEYRVFRNLFPSLGYNILLKSSGDIKLFVDGGYLEPWLLSNGYSLILVSWSFQGHIPAVIEVVEVAGRHGIPILFIPGAETNLLETFGLMMVNLSIFDEIFNVTVDDLTDNVYVVGVSRWGVVSGFKPIAPKTNLSIYWEPLVMSGEYALAVVGNIGSARVAAIAPYLYADDSYDNEKLFINILSWLLNIEDEGGEAGVWDSVAFKNITEALNELLNEVEGLKAERDALKEEIQMLGNITEEIKNLNDKLRELEVRYESELRLAYRIVGLGASVGIVIGVLMGYWLFKRRYKGV